MGSYGEEILMLEILNELTRSEILRKQRSITRLFPTFNDRVRAVGQNGGVRLARKSNDVWTFSVASGTDTSKSYNAQVKFKDLESLITDAAKSKNVWKVKGGLDVVKLSRKILEEADLDVRCSCPAALYYGSDYILTKRDAKHGRKEGRPPKKRNPREYGAICKHMQLVFDVLPFYSGTLSSYISKRYKKLIQGLGPASIEESLSFTESRALEGALDDYV